MSHPEGLLEELPTLPEAPMKWEVATIDDFHCGKYVHVNFSAGQKGVLATDEAGNLYKMDLHQVPKVPRKKPVIRQGRRFGESTLDKRPEDFHESVEEFSREVARLEDKENKDG